MRESVSMTSLFQIVILFILLFTAIMCLTINNSNAFGVKDELVNIIELSEGHFLDDGKLKSDIVEAINAATYRTTGYCSDGYVGYRKDGTQINSGEKASVCIREVSVTSELDNYLKNILDQNNTGLVATDDFIPGSYYQIVVFYQLDLPIINQVYHMETKGETKIIYDR